MKTFIEIKTETTILNYFKTLSFRGKVGLLILWIIGVVSFNKKNND